MNDTQGKFSERSEDLAIRASKYGSCPHCPEHTHHRATGPTRCFNCGDEPGSDDYLNISVGDVVTVSPDGFTYCCDGCCGEDHEPRVSAAAERLKTDGVHP